MGEDGTVRICVYCSSSSVVDEAYVNAARELGRLIGERGHSLVYGGASVGLMHELAQSVHDAGGRITGIIPRRLAEYGLVESLADELVVTESMAERKSLMEERGEAFVALPGGFGTLEELLQIITLKQLGYVQGAIVLLDVAGFYMHLIQHFERLYRERFAKPIYRQLYHLAGTPDDALSHIERYNPTDLGSKWT